MAKRKGLGKGLDALIPSDLSGKEESQAGVKHIAIEKIAPNPLQPRGSMEGEELEELTASIREHGILQPLIITQDKQADTYTLIAGERRLRAAKMAGLESVPVILHESADDQLRLELALIENLQREDLSPTEAAGAYQQLSEDFGLSHEEIAQKVGKSRTAVTNTIRLLKLPQEVLEALDKEQISEGHARALLSLPTAKAQKAALATILRNELNVRQSEDLVRKYSGQKTSGKSKQSPVSAEVREIEEKLREVLGTKVALRHSEKGGTITIHYYSQEELESIFERIVNA